MPRRYICRRPKDKQAVMAYHSDHRLREFARGLREVGCDETLTPAEVQAEGILARLRRQAWLTLDDHIGTSDDVETILCWSGPPRYLVNLLLRGGWLRDANGAMYATDVIGEAPDYIRVRWTRERPDNYRWAQERQHDSPRAIFTSAEDAEQLLFGVPTVKLDYGRGNDQGHAEIVKFYHDRYLVRHGAKYPWRPKDFSIVKRLRAAIKDDARLRILLEAYLANTKPFYGGHDIGKLLANLPEFIGSGVSSAGKAGQGQSSATTDGTVL